MTDSDKIRVCLESLYEFSEGMPDECYAVDPECKPARWWKVRGHWTCGRCQMYFDPLTQDEHAMQLVKAHHLHIDQRPGKQITVQDPHFAHMVYADMTGMMPLNRAIMDCVVAMQKASPSAAVMHTPEKPK